MSRIDAIRSSVTKSSVNPSPNANKKEQITMAQNPTPSKPSNAPKTAAPSNGKPAPAAEPKKAKRPRVRWVSTTEPAFWVRSYKDVTDKFGPPKDHNGVAMVAKAGVPFGQPKDPAEKAARIAAKAAEKAKFDAMSDEQKLQFAKAKREAKQKETEIKRAAERAALVAQIKAEIAAGKL